MVSTVHLLGQHQLSIDLEVQMPPVSLHYDTKVAA